MCHFYCIETPLPLPKSGVSAECRFVLFKIANLHSIINLFTKSYIKNVGFCSFSTIFVRKLQSNNIRARRYKIYTCENLAEIWDYSQKPVLLLTKTVKTLVCAACSVSICLLASDKLCLCKHNHFLPDTHRQPTALQHKQAKPRKHELNRNTITT